MSATTMCRTATHQSEMVSDGPQLIVGCTCGWTCAGHCDDYLLAYGAFMAHARAAL